MQGYAETTQQNLGEMLETLFNRYVQEPSEKINKVYKENGSLDKLDEFQRILHTYLNETISDMEFVADTSEAYETDKAMIEVFREIIRNVTTHPQLINFSLIPKNTHTSKV